VTHRPFLDLSRKLLRVRRLPLLAAVLACLGFASTASATPEFRDIVASAKATRAPQAIAEWGGPTVATNGEAVTIYLSSTYPVDPAVAKQWADFMTTLIHGPELATASIHLAPLAEVQRACGGQALACYFPREAAIYAPAEDPKLGVSAKGVLAHEFGHHIAASRLNPPFHSVDYGTKRWATYEDVCAKSSAGDLYPGAEDLRHYMLNPGEAFAESYRVLNEQRLALPQEGWDIITPSLFPDATALSLIEQDILTPWTANTTRRLTARLTAKIRARNFTLSTPYDGSLTIAPRQSGHVKVRVSLLASGSTVDSSSFTRVSGPSLTTTVCGKRAYRLRATLPGAVTKTTKTTLTFAISTP
jgi:hypothetical protein